MNRFPMHSDRRRVEKIGWPTGQATAFITELPADFPICYFGGSSRFEILATAFSEVSPEIFRRQTCHLKEGCVYDDMPFKTGYMGIIPYQDTEYTFPQPEPQMRVYRINETLVWDHILNTTYRCGRRSRNDHYTLPEQYFSQKYQRPPDKKDETQALQLTPEKDRSSYLATVEAAIEDIRSGRYYQINLLRFFRVYNQIDRRQLARRISALGGPFSLLFQFPDYTVASFSPERFIEINPQESSIQIRTQPIKGTAGRIQNVLQDKLAAMTLAASAKDNAELHIIVDLMRNDLNRICETHSVTVASPGTVVSYETVHHLVAEITGRLRSNLTIGEILSALLPGGSITGAPKREVMSAIREFEGRSRRFFMGTGFYLDDSGHFDSSILIRTLVKESSDPFEYAAGSGIVINSNPQQEYEETQHKCRVVTENVY